MLHPPHALIHLSFLLFSLILPMDNIKKMGDEAAFSITYTDGEKETATFITRDGSAKATYPNGSSYEGSFHEKKKHGQGTYIWMDGEDEPKEICRYSGAYDNGKRQGLGKMTFPDGSYYHGMWENNKKCGEGTYKYVNGDVYSGTWVDDVKSGNGAYEFASDKSQVSVETSSCWFLLFLCGI
jgi:hypothetical protein